MGNAILEKRSVSIAACTKLTVERKKAIANRNNPRRAQRQITAKRSSAFRSRSYADAACVRKRIKCNAVGTRFRRGRRRRQEAHRIFQNNLRAGEGTHNRMRRKLRHHRIRTRESSRRSNRAYSGPKPPCREHRCEAALRRNRRRKKQAAALAEIRIQPIGLGV